MAKEEKKKTKLPPKHRLIFLGTILVALILFYFGLDLWMKQKEVAQKQPPPVIVRTPPVLTQKQPVQPPQVVKPQAEKPKIPEKKEIPKEKVQKVPATVQIAKKEVKKTEKKVSLRNYTFQIGAFKYSKNATRLAKKAEKLGFDAKVVEKEGLYKVYVNVKAKRFKEALRIIRKHFKDAFPAKG